MVEQIQAPPCQLMTGPAIAQALGLPSEGQHDTTAFLERAWLGWPFTASPSSG